MGAIAPTAPTLTTSLAVTFITNFSKSIVNSIFFQCSSRTKVDSKDFEELLTKAIKGQYLGIKVDQIRSYPKKDLKKKMVYTLRNALDQKRIVLDSFQTVAFGYKSLPNDC